MRKVGWAVMTALALFIALYSAALLSVPAMRPPFLNDQFNSVPVVALLHLAASATALAVGPFQHNTRIRGRFLTAHRWLGRTYVIAVILGGSAGFVLATMSQGGMVTYLGFGALAVLWLFTTVMAYLRSVQKTRLHTAAG